MPSLFGFILIFFLGLSVLGCLVLLVGLIVNHKTRPIGLGVAGVLAVIVVAVFVVTSVFSVRSMSRSIPYTRARVEYSHGEGVAIDLAPDIAKAEATSWTCSMHPQIRQPRPGKCPLCRMNLVPVSTSTEGDSSDEKITTTPAPEQPARTKPKWVTAPPKRVGDSYRRVIQSGPFVSEDGCNLQLDELMTAATAKYLDQLVGTDHFADRHDFYYLRRLGIAPSYIRRHICKDEYIETVESSVGPMKQIYILMEFDADVQRRLRRLWKDLQLEGRLEFVGIGSGAVLLLIGAVFGFLKLDTATKGFYTKRLIFGAIAVIMAPFLVVALLTW